MKEYVEKALLFALKNSSLSKELPSGTRIEEPKDTNLGDLATNVSFILSKRIGKSPELIAEELSRNLRTLEIFEDVRPARGFINFRFSKAFLAYELRKVLKDGEEYFREDLGKGKKVQIEFVSANPTGPLHLGHGRGAVVGDVLARVMSFMGADVVREYYINDAGRQVYMLGISVLFRYNELFKKRDLNNEIREIFEREGYKGDYVKEIARLLASIVGESLVENNVKKAHHLILEARLPYSHYVHLFKSEEDDKVELCALFGLDIMMKEIRKDLSDLRVSFDSWVSERELRQRGEVDKVLEELGKRKQIYEAEGALWLKTSKVGDDKDRVLRKSDGELTYFASDIAYHLDKFRKGFSRVIDLWGADHHGYIKRVKSALKMLGIDENWLEVYIIQMVRLFRGGREVKMSKRTGDFVPLRELLDEVGADPIRFIFLTRRSDTPLDFNVDLVKEKTSENPVFYVQYAHARIAGVFREFKKRYGRDPVEAVHGADLEALKLEQELKLIKKILILRDVLISVHTGRDPHLITYYLIDLASEFHNYYNHNRIIGSEEKRMLARLALLNGVRISIALGLKLLGVSAPERM